MQNVERTAVNVGFRTKYQNQAMKGDGVVMQENVNHNIKINKLSVKLWWEQDGARYDDDDTGANGVEEK